MHKYEELEKVYYKRRNIKFIAMGIGVFFSFILISVLIYNSFDNEEKKEKITHIAPKKVIKKELHKEKESKNIITKKKTKEEDFSPIIKMPKDELNDKLTLYPIFPTEVIQQKEPISKPIEKIDKKQIEKNITKTSKPKIVLKPKLNIVVKDEITNIKDLEESYKQVPTYDLAIKITQFYFDKKEYKKSIEWAKKANRLKPDKYESWYYFAKTLIKLNKKSKAKQVLVAYLNTYGPSQEIEELLRSLK